MADPRVRVVVQETPIGIGENWTRATSEATGSAIRLLCADDLLEPGVLRHQVHLLDAHPDAVAVTGPRRIIDERGNVVLPKRGGGGLRAQLSGRAALRQSVLAGTNIFGEPSAILFRAAPLKACLPWSARFPYMLDIEMYARVFQLGSVLYDSKIAASFRVHSGSWSLDLGRQQARDYRRWADWVLDADLIDARPGDRLRGRAAAQLNQYARAIVYRYRVTGRASATTTRSDET